MTVSELRKRLVHMEREGLGDVPVLVETGDGEPCEFGLVAYMDSVSVDCTAEAGTVEFVEP